MNMRRNFYWNRNNTLEIQMVELQNKCDEYQKSTTSEKNTLLADKVSLTNQLHKVEEVLFETQTKGNYHALS